MFIGLGMSMNPLYIQEVSPNNLKGAVATTNTLGILVGMLLSMETALGTRDQWDLMLCLSLIPALLQYLLMPFCPESPRYLLLTRGQEAKAESALLRLRGDQDMVREEMRRWRR
ncbi:unnamed protein product [Arctogadus glacialis]